MIDIKPPKEEKSQPFEGVDEVLRKKNEAQEEPLEKPKSAFQAMATKYATEDFLFGNSWEYQRLNFLVDTTLLIAMLVDDRQKPNEISKELHAINNTLKDILKEMRKRK